MAKNNHQQYIIAVEGFVYHNGKYLMIERGDHEAARGELSCVGGGLELTAQPDNVFEDELRREFREEVGLEIGRIDYAFSKAFIFPHNNQPVVGVCFLCEYIGGIPYIADADEIASVEWLTYKQILSDTRRPIWMTHEIKLAEEKRRQLSAE